MWQAYKSEVSIILIIYYIYYYSQASFKKGIEANNYNNNEKCGEAKLNPVTIKNLNEFYIQGPMGEGPGKFNLSNFYMNHGKYFSINNGSFCNSYNCSK